MSASKPQLMTLAIEEGPNQKELEEADTAQGVLDLSFVCVLGHWGKLINGLAGMGVIDQRVMVIVKNPQLSYRQDGHWVGCGRFNGFMVSFSIHTEPDPRADFVTFQVK